LSPAGTLRGSRGARMSWPIILLLAFWVFMIMEPDWYLVRKIGGPWYRLPTLLIPFLLYFTLSRQNKRSVYWPLIIVVLLHLGASIYSENAGYAREPFKFMTYMLLLFASSVTLIDTPARYALLFKVYLVSFAWYGVQGIPNGLVEWHPALGNQDGYGPLMGIAIGFAYYASQAFRSSAWKIFGYTTCAIGLIGVVSASARGAVLAAVVVLGVIWIRSPRKFATLGAGFLGILVLIAAIQIIFPSGEFFEEMATISGGAERGTGQQRLEMWKMSWPVFLESPIVGVGASNFGVVAFEVVPEDLGRAQLQDPAHLYTMRLHSVYVSVFCEQGIVGMVCWIWILVVFVKQLNFLRSKTVVRAWRASDSSAPNIVFISLALEVGMIGYLASAIFYNQTYIHWFWTLVTLAYTAHEVARRAVMANRSRPSVSVRVGDEPPPSSTLGAGLLKDRRGTIY
jgi:O-antigen ligase